MSETQEPNVISGRSPRGRSPAWAAGAILIIALVVAWFAWPSADRGREERPERITVAQWGQERYLIYLPLYIAIEEGYFAREGLDVSLIFTGNDDQTFAAVVGGSAQFGVGDPAFAAISNEKGLPAKVIATVVGGVAIWGVTKNERVRELRAPADLAGLRIGTFPSPSTNYTLMKALLEQDPATHKDTKIVEADIGAQIALLESGAADLAMVLEPAASVAERQGYRVVYSSPRFHGPFVFTGVTTTDQYLKGHRGTAQKFVNALQNASRAAHRDRAIAVRVAKKLFSTLEPEVVEKAVGRMLDEQTLPSDVAISERAWQALLDVRLKVGDLSTNQPLGTSVDNSFAKAAKGAD